MKRFLLVTIIFAIATTPAYALEVHVEGGQSASPVHVESQGSNPAVSVNNSPTTTPTEASPTPATEQMPEQQPEVIVVQRAVQQVVAPTVVPTALPTVEPTVLPTMTPTGTPQTVSDGKQTYQLVEFWRVITEPLAKVFSLIFDSNHGAN